MDSAKLRKHKIRMALKHRLDSSFLLSKSEIKQEVGILKVENNQYTAFKSSTVESIDKELKDCTTIIIKPAKDLYPFFDKLLKDTSFTSIFDIDDVGTDGEERLYRIKYTTFDS